MTFIDFGMVLDDFGTKTGQNMMNMLRSAHCPSKIFVEEVELRTHGLPLRQGVPR